MDLVGRTLGPYEIRAHVGRGGVADVYRAVHQGLAAEVALKVLFEDSADDAEQIARFQRESRVLARLSHPGIVEVHDCGSEGSIHYFAMALLEHLTLSALLDVHRQAGGWLPEPQAIAVTISILDVLSVVHQEQIIHRDLKPSNIFVTSDDQAIVSDFGLVKVIDEASLTTSPDQVLGTIQYMAPEQILSEPADVRADLYAVGLVLHRMLYGQLPFGDQMAEVVQKKTLFSGLKPTGARPVMPALTEIVARACRRDRRERFQTAAEFADVLGSVAASTMVVSRRNAIPPKPASPGRGTAQARALRHEQAAQAASGERPRHPATPRAPAPAGTTSGAIRRARWTRRGMRFLVRGALGVLALTLAGAVLVIAIPRFSDGAAAPSPASGGPELEVDATLVAEAKAARASVRGLLLHDCFQLSASDVVSPDVPRYHACFGELIGRVGRERTRLAVLESKVGRASDAAGPAVHAVSARVALLDFLAACRERSVSSLHAQLGRSVDDMAAHRQMLAMRAVMDCEPASLARLVRATERARAVAARAVAAPERAGSELGSIVEDYQLLAWLHPKYRWNPEVDAAVGEHLRSLPAAVARMPGAAAARLGATLETIKSAGAASGRGALGRGQGRALIEDLSGLRAVMPGAREGLDSMISEAWKDLERARGP